MGIGRFRLLAALSFSAVAVRNDVSEGGVAPQKKKIDPVEGGCYCYDCKVNELNDCKSEVEQCAQDLGAQEGKVYVYRGMRATVGECEEACKDFRLAGKFLPAGAQPGKYGRLDEVVGHPAVATPTLLSKAGPVPMEDPMICSEA
mmetsp:Transcript_74935/g.219528  ORF Transcript_74935/g.219528 Transcript_74935/m.219528 type:complete len:145 (+) Transcript_74935:62-496(+)